MLKFSLDWNCVIEVEESRPQAKFVQCLVDAHRNKLAETALLAASASENTGSRVFPGTAKHFHDRIEKLGWHDLPIVLVPCIIGLTYTDYSFIVGDEKQYEASFSNIWSAMFRNLNSDPKSHLSNGQPLNSSTIQDPELWKWRNAWCDVISAYSHIEAKRDIFVTNNISDFQRNEKALAMLGMTKIKTPEHAVLYL